VYFSIASKKFILAGEITNYGRSALMKCMLVEPNYPCVIGPAGQKDGSKQIEFARLGKNDGIGIQLLMLSYTMILGALKNNDVALTSTHGGLSLSDVAKNDGLSLQDFKDYFKGYDLSEPLAIIHFTKFRY
jgi:hypothetical protein